MGSLEHRHRWWTCDSTKPHCNWAASKSTFAWYSAWEFFVLCWQSMKLGTFMWIGRAWCAKMISLKTKIWLRAMCISVVFYCARRSIDVTTRQLGLSFKNLVSYLHWHIIFWKFYQHLVWLYQLTKLVILKYPFHLCPLSLCSWLVRISYKYFFFVI